MTVCSFPDCGRKARGHGLCSGHYTQARRGQDLRPLRASRPHIEGDGCGAEGCDRLRRHGSRYCRMHGARYERHGDPSIVIAPDERDLPRGERHHAWAGDSADYWTVHQRVRKWKGKASKHQCRCGKQAAQWAFIGPRSADERMPFDTDVNLFEPMCISCHKRMDMAAIRAEAS